jgi:hypothetical protein
LNIWICYHDNLSAALISPSQQLHAPVDGRREWRLQALGVRTIAGPVPPLLVLTYTKGRRTVPEHFLQGPAIQEIVVTHAGCMAGVKIIARPSEGIGRPKRVKKPTAWPKIVVGRVQVRKN